MTSLRRIGILGGMGPATTILLQQKLMDAVQANDDRDHIPLIIDMNPQVPSRIDHLIHHRGDDPAPVMAQMAQRLQTAGAEALAMPCNTAHHYAGAITGAVTIPFLNMVELSADRVAATLATGDCVGLLASPAVRSIGLFDAAMTRRGLNSLWPDDQQTMLRAIQIIKAKGRCPEACDTLRAASEELASQGATYQLVACSEFSLIADSIGETVTAVDTLDVLVSAIRKFSFGESSEG